MNYSILTSRVFALFLLICAVTASGAILKRFDAESKQDGYLKSFRPPALALRVPNPIPADRYNLLFLPVLSIESNASESNATIVAPPVSTTEASSVEVPKPNFPIVAPPILVTPPPVVLPPPDPFDVPANREPSTDDLIDALEREQIKSSSGRQDFLPFIPPYSAAPANLEIRSEAKYIRTPRQ
ncbi:MAG: hypothetical protein HN494_01805 [Opitutae bacterium]|jgi:hypothetical protein|nr:hypothetical protein [Opitutae bacterium]MBT5908530.1 hypothetical protein [Opitutae bacterium]MBT6850432.1 hypothetical protein [Opitutae bacterium]MBT7742537.1 hypothetical protein [Opitutae bacterium]MBT7924839.1 hypothetical protein [Opitutae bacterium]